MIATIPNSPIIKTLGHYFYDPVVERYNKHLGESFKVTHLDKTFGSVVLEEIQVHVPLGGLVTITREGAFTGYCTGCFKVIESSGNVIVCDECGGQVVDLHLKESFDEFQSVINKILSI
jgi:hypothetical protein